MLSTQQGEVPHLLGPTEPERNVAVVVVQVGGFWTATDPTINVGALAAVPAGDGDLGVLWDVPRDGGVQHVAGHKAFCGELDLVGDDAQHAFWRLAGEIHRGQEREESLEACSASSRTDEQVGQCLDQAGLVLHRWQYWLACGGWVRFDDSSSRSISKALVHFQKKRPFGGPALAPNDVTPHQREVWASGGR